MCRWIINDDHDLIIYIYAHACTVHAYAHYSGCSTLFCSVHARTRSEGGLDSRVWVWPHSVQVCLSIWLSWRQVRGLCIQALWLLCSALSDLSHTHTWESGTAAELLRACPSSSCHVCGNAAAVMRKGVFTGAANRWIEHSCDSAWTSTWIVNYLTTD